MNNRQRMRSVLNYQHYDSLPIIHFGFWSETLQKWADEGHITHEEAAGWHDGSQAEKSINSKLGFDFNYFSVCNCNVGLMPAFEREVIETLPDGTRKVLDHNGAVVLEKDDAGSIPAEVDHLLKDRKAWEELYLPKLQFCAERVNVDSDYVDDPDRTEWVGIFCGSLFGVIRNWLGVENSAYLYVDDEPLFREMIDTVGELSYQCVKLALEKAKNYDFAHFWEDICFKNGPLVAPRVFEEYVGPHYKRVTDLLRSNSIDIVSLDCDGCIDALIPTWLSNGVNTMFPIEVGTWGANIKPWREQYGKEIRGVGGMNKVVFARDYAAIDKEIERLKPLVELGGYIPCPDHRIPPDAKWENVQYYCDKMRSEFGS